MRPWIDLTNKVRMEENGVVDCLQSVCSFHISYHSLLSCIARKNSAAIQTWLKREMLSPLLVILVNEIPSFQSLAVWGECEIERASCMLERQVTSYGRKTILRVVYKRATVSTHVTPNT